MNYFVDYSLGRDTNPGTSGQPFQTLQKGFSFCRQPDDTLNVRAGSYAGAIAGWDSSGDYGPIIGAIGHPIIIQADPAAPPGSVIIKSRNNKTQDAINFEPANGDQNYIIIRGFIVNCDTSISRAGIRISQSTGVQLLNCSVVNAGSFGIFSSHATDLLIQGNSVTGTKGSDTKGHGIYCANSETRPTIRGNTIFKNGSVGIHMNGDGSDGVGSGIITGALVELNAIYGNADSGINCDGVQGSTFQNNQVYSNSKHGLAGYAIDALGPFKGNTVARNTFWNNAGSQIQLTQGNTGNPGASGNTIANNILIGGKAAITLDSVSLSNTSDGNAVSNAFSADYGTSSITLAQWQTRTGQDKSSFIATAASIFTNAVSTPPDLHTPTMPTVGAYAAITPPPPVIDPAFQAACDKADTNGDGVVDYTDFGVIATQFGAKKINGVWTFNGAAPTTQP